MALASRVKFQKHWKATNVYCILHKHLVYRFTIKLNVHDKN